MAPRKPRSLAKKFADLYHSAFKTMFDLNSPLFLQNVRITLSDIGKLEDNMRKANPAEMACFHNAKFKNTSYRFVYLYAYSVLHSVIVSNHFFEYVQSNLNGISHHLSERKLNLCCLGGGCGLEAIAICKVIENVFLMSKDGNDESWVLDVYINVIDIQEEWEQHMHSLVETVNESSSSFLPSKRIKLHAKFIEADLLEPFTDDVERAISEANIVTMIKLASYIEKDLYAMGATLQNMLENILKCISKENYFLFLDNADGPDIRCFTKTLSKCSYVGTMKTMLNKAYSLDAKIQNKMEILTFKNNDIFPSLRNKIFTVTKVSSFWIKIDEKKNCFKNEKVIKSISPNCLLNFSTAENIEILQSSSNTLYLENHYAELYCSAFKTMFDLNNFQFLQDVDIALSDFRELTYDISNAKSGESPFFDNAKFKNTSYRFAYLYAYGVLHSVIVSKHFSEYVQSNLTGISHHLSKRKLNLCCLGGGCGLEAIAICKVIENVVLKSKGGNKFWILNVYVTIIDICQEWEHSMHSFVGTVNECSSNFFPSRRIKLHAKFIQADLLKPFRDDVERAISKANIVTMIKLASSMERQSDAEQATLLSMIENIIKCISKGNYFLFLDDALPDDFGCFKRTLSKSSYLNKIESMFPTIYYLDQEIINEMKKITFQDSKISKSLCFLPQRKNTKTQVFSLFLFKISESAAFSIPSPLSFENQFAELYYSAFETMFDLNSLQFLQDVPIALSDIRKLKNDIKEAESEERPFFDNAKFKYISYRFAYLYAYGVIHSVIVSNHFSEYIQSNLNGIFQHLSKRKLNLCCLGGGCGLEAIAICKEIENVFLMSKDGNDESWVLDVYINVIDTQEEWEQHMHSLVETVNESSSSFFPSKRIKLHAKFIHADLLKRFRDDVKRAIRQANIVTMVKLASSIERNWDSIEATLQGLLENIIKCISEKNYLLLLDNAGGPDFRCFIQTLSECSYKYEQETMLQKACSLDATILLKMKKLFFKINRLLFRSTPDITSLTKVSSCFWLKVAEEYKITAVDTTSFRNNQSSNNERKDLANNELKRQQKNKEDMTFLECNATKSATTSSKKHRIVHLKSKGKKKICDDSIPTSIRHFPIPWGATV